MSTSVIAPSSITPIDADALADAYDDAKRRAAAHPAWLVAIDDGMSWLLEQAAVEHDAEGNLMILSTSDWHEYRAGRTCTEVASGEPCVAFAAGQPCEHRAAARLVLRMVERVAAREWLLAEEAQRKAERKARRAASQAAIDELYPA